MATGRSVTIDDLKKSLKSRISQYEMLSKSLLEVFERNPLSKSINDIRDAINETTDDIRSLQKLIDEKNNEVKYSFYDAIKKPVEPEETTAKKVSMFDCIKKNNSDDEMLKKNNSDDEYVKKISSTNPYEKVTRTNAFLVRFNGLNIKEWMVRNVGYLSKNQLGITIFDHVVNNRPIIADINNLIVSDRKISIIIDHLDETGKVIYSERFHDCKIFNQVRNDLDYESSDFSTITMMVTFKEVTYETAH
jgi:hypothetical protein